MQCWGVRKWCISPLVLHVVLNVSVMDAEPVLWAMENHQEPLAALGCFATPTGIYFWPSS